MGVCEGLALVGDIEPLRTGSLVSLIGVNVLAVLKFVNPLPLLRTVGPSPEGPKVDVPRGFGDGDIFEIRRFDIEVVNGWALAFKVGAMERGAYMSVS